MTTAEWLEQARRDAPKLRLLIAQWHPVLVGGQAYQMQRINEHMPITAVVPELACEDVREHIRRNSEGDPLARFNNALDAGDIGTVSAVLNDAWFGVPESTSCWRLDGFKEAVALLEDLPED